ncbi:MAG: DpnII family type II restriction endonuclease [Bacteroidota bacterium]
MNPNVFGFKSNKEYLDSFIENLLHTNKTFYYYVNWRKIKNNVNLFLEEISILNSLTKVPKNKLEKEFIRIIKKYPKVVKVIPLLIAERLQNEKLTVFDSTNEKYLELDFNQPIKNYKELIYVCKNLGILDLFQSVKDLYDYLLGVEVGLDTNSRKNRSGEIFEKLCFDKLSKSLGKKYKIVQNDKNFSLFPKLSSGKNKSKKHDFVIYSGKNIKYLVESSFYNVSGSKPVSIAESYIKLNEIAGQNGIAFIWITDGPGWAKMKEPLLLAMENIDYVVNFHFLNTLLPHL